MKDTVSDSNIACADCVEMSTQHAQLADLDTGAVESDPIRYVTAVI